MFDRSSRGGRTAALLISGLLATLFITGSASPQTTYHITDGEAVYTVTGKSGDTEAALAQAGVEVSERDRVTSAVQEDGSVSVTVERPVTTYEEQVVDLLPYDTLRQADPDLPLGQEQVVQTGTQGTVSAKSRVVTDPDTAACASPPWAPTSPRSLWTRSWPTAPGWLPPPSPGSASPTTCSPILTPVPTAAVP